VNFRLFCLRIIQH